MKPAGAADTESPCDIQTERLSGSSLSRVEPGVTASGVRPNSESPVRSTVPPRASAMAWNP